MVDPAQIQPFAFKNCSLAALATGERANSLPDLRNKLAVIPENSIFYHFWGSRLFSRFVHPHYHNDFAAWVAQRLNDHVLAEKLNIIDPKEFINVQALREELLDTIDRRLDDYDIIISTKRDDQFHFISSKIIVFETSLAVLDPKDLAHVIPLLPPSSIFYHFIDARTRTENREDDFSVWLKQNGNGFNELVKAIQSIDPYFVSLTEVKKALSDAVANFFQKVQKHV